MFGVSEGTVLFVACESGFGAVEACTCGIRSVIYSSNLSDNKRTFGIVVSLIPDRLAAVGNIAFFPFFHL